MVAVSSGRTRAAAAKAEAKNHLERLLWDLGYARVAGVDEVGMGPLAGPVVAAAVVCAPGSCELALRDSKRLTAARRESLDGEIRATALSVAVGVVEVSELDRAGIHRAGLEAMRRAVHALRPEPDYLLVDARRVPGVEVGQSYYDGADGFVYSVAAASIVAKVYRDSIMKRLDERFPGYGLGRHMGYGTVAHMDALNTLGPSPVHRRSFAPVKKLLGVVG